MQLKYSFKKEWLHFSRTFRVFGIILAIFSFALADPFMYRALGLMMEMLTENADALTAVASVGTGAGAGQG